VNVNFTSTGPEVIAANLRAGIPFPDESFDVVYHSHVLEHLTKAAAADFLKECCRVLKPGGIIRVAVPDLEAIARNYLLALENAKAGMAGWNHHYDWMLLELYDQVVRDHSGGEMARYLLAAHIPNEEYVVGRCGTEARNIIASGRNSRASAQIATQPTAPATRKLLGMVSVPTSLRTIYRMLRNPVGWKEALLQKLLGNEYEALQTGRFRSGGEIHQWMYDSYSLGRLLQACGFRSVTVRSATESDIPRWPSYNLDTEPDGSVYKPDSLFIEARK
jgi:SAM-dependent methyltransferase